MSATDTSTQSGAARLSSAIDGEEHWVRSGQPLAAIVVDLDDLGEIEASQDSSVTERVLREIPGRCCEVLPESMLVHRLTAGEFVIAGRATAPEAALLAERLKVLFNSRPFAGTDGMFIVRASFGVTERQTGDTSFQQVLTRAQMAVGIAKERGGNRVETLVTRESNEPITDGAPRRESGYRLLEEKETTMPIDGPRQDKRWSQIPAFDSDTLEQLKELVDEDDTSFLDELYENYLASARGNLSELQAQVDQDVKRRAAHTLKGSSLNVGAVAVALACKELEHGLSDQTSEVDVDAWVEVIERELERVRTGWIRAIRSA